MRSNLSEELQTLIKRVTESKSREEEEFIVRYELSLLPKQISEAVSIPATKEILLRGIYFEVLGHQVEATYITAINLSQSRHLPLKKLGYLASSLFLKEDDEISILIISSMQKDLVSKDEDSIIAALNCFCQLGFVLMAQALYPLILPLVQHKNLLIRKKALYAICKIGSLPNFEEAIVKAIGDKSLGVAQIGLVMLSKLMEREPLTSKSERFIDPLATLLTNILDHTHTNKDYDYHAVPAPWMQVKILKLLLPLFSICENHERAETVLKKCLVRNSNIGTNIGNALAYQVSLTIAQLPFISDSVVDDAFGTISSLLTSQNPNFVQMGIKGLKHLVKRSQSYAIEHQLVILDCLVSKDSTIKKETLKFLFSMANFSNIETIVSTLLKSLSTEENREFKENMISKILEISERFASSQSWFLSTMKSVLKIAEDWISPKVFNSFVSVVEDIYRSNPEETQGFICKLFCQDKAPPKGILSIRFLCWVIGEIASNFCRFVHLDKEEVNKLEDFVILLNSLLQKTSDFETINYIVSAFLKCKVFLLNAEQLFSHEKIFSLNSIKSDYTLVPLRLSHMALGLMESSQLQIDSSLSFLDSYCERAIEGGAKEYSKKPIYTTINQEEKQLRFESYMNAQFSQQNETFQMKTQKLWSETGYKHDKQEKLTEKINKLPFNSNEPQTKIFSEKEKRLQNVANSLFSAKIFEGLKFRPTKIQVETPQRKVSLYFTPCKMSNIEFESLWESLKTEKILEMMTAIDTKDSYLAFLSRVGFQEIDVIENEIIAGAISDEKTVLLYGKTSASGFLELRLKAKEESRIEEFAASVLSVLMKYYKKLD